MAAPPLVLPAPSSPQRTPGRADSPHSPVRRPAAGPPPIPHPPQHQPAPLGSPVLGKGSFGSVNLVRDPQSAALTALKSVRKDAPKRGSVVPYECAKAEAEALRAIGGHPHIVKLLDAYDTDDCYCLVLEVRRGGSVPDISRPSHYAELFRPLSAASQLRQGAGLSPSLVPEPPAAAAVPDNGSESDDDDDDDSSASSASSLSSAAASLDDVAAAAAAAPATLDLP